RCGEIEVIMEARPCDVRRTAGAMAAWHDMEGCPSMNNDFPKIVRPDTSHYTENRKKFTYEDLLPYADQWVAWSPDGTRVLASGKDLFATIEQMKATGLNPHEAVWESFPPLGAEDTLL